MGIAGYEQMKARTAAIARGEYRPAADEPKVWFTSAESFARVLSDYRRIRTRIACATGGTDWAKEIKPVPNAKDHGALRLRTSRPGSAGLSGSASPLPSDLADAAVVEAEAGWPQSCVISLQLQRTGDSTLRPRHGDFARLSDDVPEHPRTGRRAAPARAHCGTTFSGRYGR